MKKKFITLGIAFLMLFSFTGCNSLADYKVNAKIKLDNYISKLPDSFSELLPTFESVEAKNHINGLRVDKIVNDGKNSIDNASNKKNVDTALDTAKREFDTIPITFPMSCSSPTADGETGAFGHHLFFYLKIFDENIFFECAADVGAMLSFPRSDEPLSPIYDGFFGRQPQVVRWYIPFVENALLQNKDFIDFTIKIDDTIIGYIVVEINFVDTDYIPKLLASTVNPKIDGEYQAMDEDQVQIDIASIKGTND